MAVEQFDIVFRGVREGFDAAQVKAQFATLFKLDAPRVERIFKARKVTLKTNLTASLADKYIARLAAVGVLVDKLPLHQPEASPVSPSRAIHIPDNGEEYAGAGAMHQPVDFLYGENIRRIPFTFSGKGLGYFRIWLVNILVCLFSAGILLPWAQARSLRYFYEHTSLDNVEFDYSPALGKILLVQLVLMVYIANLIYSYFTAPGYFLLGLAVLSGLLPLFMLKLRQFHMSRSSYRGQVAYYSSSILEAYYAFLFLPILTLATAGLAAPWALWRIQRYLVQSKSIGQFRFQLASYWKNYLPLLPPLLIADVCSLGVFYWAKFIPAWVAVALLLCLWLMVFMRWRVQLMNIMWNHTQFPLGYFRANWDLPTYHRLVMQNFLLILLTMGIFWPWAKIRMAEYKAQHLAFFANLKFKKWKYSLQQKADS